MWSTFSIRYNRKKNTRTWHIFDRQHPKEPPQDIAHFRATGGHPWPCPLPNDRPSCPWPSTGCKAGGKKWRSSGATMGSHTKFAPVILSIFNFKRHSVHWICIHVSYIYIHNNTIPYYPIISLFFGPSLKKHRRGAASVRSATSIMKGAPDCLVPGCPRGATSNRRSPIQSFVVFHHIHIVYI